MKNKLAQSEAIGADAAMTAFTGSYTSARANLANFDALRAFAVGLVFIGHLFDTMRVRLLGDLGHLGVLFFFVHTSFVLMLSMERLGLTGTRLYSSFLVRRIFRIYPLSLLAVFVAILAHIPSVSWNARYINIGWQGTVSNLLLLQNITHSESVVCVLWSLPFEIQMYVLLPLIFLLVRRHTSIRSVLSIWLISVAVAGCEFVARGEGGLDFLLTRYFPCFVAGIVAYRILKIRTTTLSGGFWIALLATLAVLYRLEDAVRVYGPNVLAAVEGHLRNDHQIWLPPSWDLLRDWIFCAITGVTVPFFREISIDWLNAAAKSIAKYSYGIYVCHVPIMWLCFVRLHFESLTVRILLTLALTACMSFVLYQFVEEPGIQFGKRIASRFAQKRGADRAIENRSEPARIQPQQPAVPSIHILGSRVHLVSAARTVDTLERWIVNGDGRCRQLVVTGFHGLMEAYKDPRVRAILNQADLWVPDGIAPVWLARLRGYRGVVRTPGTEIMREFFTRAQARGYRSYFFGDTEHTLAALTTTVERLYPGHHVAGVYSPPFRALTPAEDQAIIDRINAARPDVLWVALGQPKQDIWIHERLHRLRVPVAVGVGAAFAFVAGTVPRCPQWMGDAGFEWVYRFLREPRKLWRRDLLDGPRFLYHAGMEILRNENSTVSMYGDSKLVRHD